MHRAVFDRVRGTQNPVVVFDIDSTLVSTAYRHLAILRAFASTTDNPVLRTRAAELTASDFGWTVDGPLPELSDETRAALTQF